MIRSKSRAETSVKRAASTAPAVSSSTFTSGNATLQSSSSQQRKRKYDSNVLNDSTNPPLVIESNPPVSSHRVSRKTSTTSSPNTNMNTNTNNDSDNNHSDQQSSHHSLVKARAALAEKRRLKQQRLSAFMQRLEDAKSAAERAKAEALANWTLPTHWQKDFNGDYIMLLELDKNNPFHVSEWNKFNTQECSIIQQVSDGTEIMIPLALAKLWRIQNPHLYRQYEIEKSELQSKSVAFRADVLSFHGSRANDPLLLVATGLDVACGVAAPGHVWLSKRASYSTKRFAHRTERGGFQVLAVHANVLPHESENN